MLFTSESKFSTCSVKSLSKLHRGLSPDPPSPSTTSTQGPGPTDGSTTQASTTSSDSPPQTCCSSVSFQSSGAIGESKPEAVGTYRKVGSDATGRGIYKKDDLYLHYVNDVAHRFEAWVFSSSTDDLMGEIVNEDSNECADATGATWELLQGNDWVSDSSAMVTCDGNAACCTGVVVASTGGIR